MLLDHVHFFPFVCSGSRRVWPQPVLTGAVSDILTIREKEHNNKRYAYQSSVNLASRHATLKNCDVLTPLYNDYVTGPVDN